MAHRTFKVLDSDIHIIEPPDLWPRYIDPAFRDRAPSGLTEDVGDLRLAVDGKPWGRVAIDADRSREHLGPADKAIIQARRLLLGAVKSVEAGGAPRGVDPTYYTLRAHEGVIPRAADWRELLTPEMATTEILQTV